MSYFVYFANCLDQSIGINLNNNLSNSQLSSQAGSGSEPYASLNTPVAAFPSTANPDKNHFGASLGCVNDVTIYYEEESQANYYEITPSQSLTGMDLFFYVFLGNIVGVDQSGSSEGITISSLVPEPPVATRTSDRPSISVTIGADATVKKVIQTGAAPVTLPVPPSGATS
jgi:hypothetical protein